MESERFCLLGFRMVGRAGYGVFSSQSARQLCHRVADRSSDRRRQNGFAWTKTSQGKSHLRGEIRNRNAGGAYIIDAISDQAKIFLPHGNPFRVGSTLKNPEESPQPQSVADRK